MVKKVTENKKIIGAGGGGGGEVEPDTLFTNTIGKGIFIFSEGPVEGLSTGDSKSIYLNDVTLMDSNGGISHKGVSWTWRSGLPDQAYIDGFPAAVSFQNVGLEATYATPQAVTIANGSDNYDAAYVVVSCPVLQTKTDSGNLRKATLNFCIEVKSSGGSWVTVHTVNIKGKASSKWEGTYRVDLPEGGSPWEVRVRRLNEDSMTEPDGSGTFRQNQTFFERYATITDGKFTYRNTALLGIQFDAKEYGDSVPVVKAKIKGIKVWVPKNYDPVTRTYATTGAGTSGGIWDGTFKAAWTNNPIWIYHDLIVNNRYGLGQDFNPTDDPESAYVDKWSLYALSQYADEMVDDGDGGTEPRFTINTQITSKEEAYNLLQNIIAGINGMIYFSAEQIIAVADRPLSVSDAFTQADVEQGYFEYSGTSFKTRHSVCIVTYKDPNNLYKTSNVIYEDPDYIAEIGYRVTEVQAFGCTSRAQALRLAKWTLRTERTQTQTVTFKTGHRGGLLRPGDIIKIFDDYKTGQRTGGRILSSSVISGPKTEFVLDQNVTVTTADKLIYLDNTATLREFSFDQTYTDTNTVAVSGTQELPIEGGTYGIVYASLDGQQFRVLSVEESQDDGKYIVSALQHDPNKFAYVDTGIILPSPPTSVLTADALSPITEISVEKFYEEISGTQAVPKVMLSWEKPLFGASYSRPEYIGQIDSRVVDFELQFLTPLDDYRTVYKGTQTSWTSNNLEIDEEGEYAARVRGIDQIGRYSEWTYFDPFTVVGKASEPPAPTSVSATSIINGIALSWDNPAIPDFKHVEIRVNTTNTETGSTLIAEVSDDFYILNNLTDDSTRYFFLRTVSHNPTNNVSIAAATASAARKRVEQQDFASGIEPVSIVSSLPSPTGYTGPKNVFLTTDSKLYRYDGSSFVASIPTVDLIGTITSSQIADAAITTAKFASGITPVEIVSSLPTTGNFIGRQVFLTTDSKLYRYDGTSFVATIPTTDLIGTITTAQIADAALTTAKFAAGIEPVSVVSALPSPTGYTGPKTVLLTTDGKLYRYNGTAFVATIPTVDLTGTISSAQIANAAITTAKFASGITPVEIVSSLPASGNYAGRQVFLTTDNKLYRHNGTSFISTVATTDLTGTISAPQIADSAVTSAKIANAAITTTKFASGLTPVEIFATTAAAGTATLGRTIFVTADNKIYRGNGTSWIKDVDGGDITAGTITTGKIAAGAITTTELAANAVTAAKIAAGTITANEIAANAITSTKIATNAITAGKIAAGVITSVEIAADTITASNIAAGAITSTELAANSVVAGKVAAGAISTAELAAGAVTAAKIAAGTITANEIAANTITASQLAANTITANEIAANAITSSELAANSVVAGKVAAGAISTAELAAGAVTAAKIAAGTITANEIASGTITSVNIASDTITAANIAANAITSSELAANSVIAGKVAAAAISTTELAAGAVTAAKIAAGTITANEIAANTITGAKIASDTITAANIAANAITASELSANSVVAGKIAAAAITGQEIAVTAQISVGSGSQSGHISGANPEYLAWFGDETPDNAPTRLTVDGTLISRDFQQKDISGVLKWSSSGGYTQSGLNDIFKNLSNQLPTATVASDSVEHSTSISGTTDPGASKRVTYRLGADSQVSLTISTTLLGSNPTDTFATFDYKIYERYSSTGDFSSSSWTLRGTDTITKGVDFTVVTEYVDVWTGSDFEQQLYYAVNPTEISLSVAAAAKSAGYYQYAVVGPTLGPWYFDAIYSQVEATDEDGNPSYILSGNGADSVNFIHPLGVYNNIQATSVGGTPTYTVAMAVVYTPDGLPRTVRNFGNYNLNVSATASTDVFTSANPHNLVVGQKVRATENSSDFVISSGTEYWVKTVPSSTTFTLAPTSALSSTVNISADDSSIDFTICIGELNLSVNGVNGLDTGTKANSQWYYIWLISNGTVDRLLASLNSASPTMPSGYTYKKLIGACKTNSSGNVMSYKQYNDLIEFIQSSSATYNGIEEIAGSTMNATNDANDSWAPIGTTVRGNTSFVPALAPIIKLQLVTRGSNVVQVAPSNQYDGYNGTNPAPLIASQPATSIIGELILESDSIYISLNSNAPSVNCVGFRLPI